MNAVSLDRFISIWRFLCLYFHKWLQADLWSLRAVCKKDIHEKLLETVRSEENDRLSPRVYIFILGLKCTLLYPDAMVINSWMVCAVHYQ